MELLPKAAHGIERRQHKRYRVKEETFAFLGEETGTLVDISPGGLAVQYAVFERDAVLPSALDIFLAHPQFYLPNIPVLLVGEVQTVPTSIFSLLRIKRLCMQFGPLSGEQLAKIEDFIACNTITAR